MIQSADEIRKMAKIAKEKRDQAVCDKAREIVPVVMKAIVSQVQSNPSKQSICIDGYWNDRYPNLSLKESLVMSRVGQMFREAGYIISQRNFLIISWDE